MRGPAEDESDEELERRLVQTPPPVGKPQEAGSHLLMSGEFGRIGKKTASRRENVNIARILTNPPALFCPASYKEDISGVLCSYVVIPVQSTNIVLRRIWYRTVTGQQSPYITLIFTLDNFPLVCAHSYCVCLSTLNYCRLVLVLYMCPRYCKGHTPINDNEIHCYFVIDYKLRVYDMKAAPHHSGDYSHRSTMKLINTIQGQPGRWTITDSHLSPDDQRYDPSPSLIPKLTQGLHPG